MEFAEWLADQLNKRGWSQRDFIKIINSSSYKMSQGHLSHILNGKRQANAEACLGIAHALELSPEEVFQARGWLPREPEEPFSPLIDPRVIQLAKEISQLPFQSRERFLDAMEPMLDTVRQLTLKIQQLETNGHESQN